MEPEIEEAVKYRTKTIETIRMRILHIYDHFLPDLGYIENHLPRHEARLGHEVLVLVPRLHDNKLSSSFTLRLTQSSTNAMETKMTEPKFQLCSPLDVANVIRRFNPHILFVPVFNISTLIVLLMKKGSRFKVLASFGMPAKVDETTALKRAAYHLFRQLAVPFIVRETDGFSEGTPLNVLRDGSEYGVPANKLHLIRLGCDTENMFRDEEERREIRGILRLKPDVTLFIYSGRLSPDKGVIPLIRAYAVTRASAPMTRLLLLGRGTREFEDEVDSTVVQLGIAGHVTRIDLVPHDKLRGYYSAADVGVWPGSPSISIQEALACGLPVILPESGHTDFLLGHDNGFSFKTELELSNRMTTLASDQGLRVTMSMNSRKFAETELDWAVIANEAIEVYKSLPDRQSKS